MAAHEGLNGSEDWENQPTRRSRRNGHISQPICSGMLRRLPSSRKKFRSQTSDNMDGWKSRDGKSQRRSEKRREEKSGQMRNENLHAVVARSTSPSQNVQNTPFSEHF